MKNNLPLEKRYRFRVGDDGVHYFESRYYAQKFYDEHIEALALDSYREYDRYQIFKVGDEFCIVFFRWY